MTITVRVGADLVFLAFCVLARVFRPAIRGVVHALMHTKSDVFAEVEGATHEVVEAGGVGVPAPEDVIGPPVTAKVTIGGAVGIGVALVGVIDALSLAVDEVADLAVRAIPCLAWAADSGVEGHTEPVFTAHAAWLAITR